MDLMNPNSLPAVAAGVGYSAGLVLEYVAVRQAAKTQEAAMRGFGEDSSTLTESHNRISALRARAKQGIASLAVFSAVTAGIAAQAWTPDIQLQTAPPSLEVVLDHSGATLATSDGAVPVYERINEIASQFVKPPKPIDVEAIIAGSGHNTETKITNVDNDRPFGDAPLADGVKLALGRATFTKTEASNKGENRAAAVLVVTNGNMLGPISDITAEANQQQGNTPVFVVDVEHGTPNATATSLQAIANQTKATYWSAEQAHGTAIAHTVEAAITPHVVPKRSGVPGKNELKALSVLSALGVVGLYLRRKTMVFGSKVTGA